MNRIEARIIIMVTNRLAAAKDCDAKTEMIEELSENLYQRYLELTGKGIAEDEALKQALDSLGDVDELLAFLQETQDGNADAAEGMCGRTEAYHAAGTAEENAAESGTSQQSQSDTGGSTSQQSQSDADGGQRRENRTYEERNASFSKEDLENGIEEIVNAAISATRVAVDCARDMAKDVSDQFKERYSEGVFTQFSGQKGKDTEYMTVPGERVGALEIRLANGNVTLERTDGPDVEVMIEGDTQEIETVLTEEGVLSITQGKTASAAFLFLRGRRRIDVEVQLPQKVWESVFISTTSGDVDIEDELVCRELKASTTSGDLNLERVSSENMVLNLCSGSLGGDDLSGNLHVESISGEIEISGCLGRCELSSTSGNVNFEGVSREINCSSTSGDIGLSLEKLPEKLEGNSVSGDCEIIVPAGEGFHLSYHTVSGSFSTDLPMVGQMEKKCADVICGEAVCGDIKLSSVSGDISICVRR